MNAADRRFLSDLQKYAQLMGVMNPRNPSDLTTKLIYHGALVECSRIIYAAIGHHGFGDHAEALEELAKIKPTLDDAALEAFKAEGRGEYKQ